MILFGIAC